jgi:uronate dehydrogenase
LRRLRSSSRQAAKPLILITGAGGLIGSVLRQGLRNDHSIRGLDIATTTGVEHVVDLAEGIDVGPLFAGAHAVVDLAGTSDVDADWSAIRGNNIPATLNTFESARAAGVSRIVYASSNHITGMYERDEPYASILAGRYDNVDPATIRRIDETSSIRPDSPYAVAKAAGEAAGRFYWEEYGISVICLRIGTVNHQDRPTSVRHFATLLTHRDLIQLVRSALTAPLSVGFVTVYGVSANRWRIWDIERARDLLGYAPQDDAERWRP